jgi:anaerobic selenocysteine-containing dehydrogenase
MVAIDPYINETTRHAHVILPPTSQLEHSHYDLGLATLAVRNIAKYSPPVFARAADQRHDSEICLELWSRLVLPKLVGRALRPALRRLQPEAILELALRAGRYRLSLAKLRGAPHGLDLGPLEPRLPARLRTPDKRVALAPRLYLDDLPRLRARLASPAPELVLIGRRHLRSNNSWMHNSTRLVKGKPRCTLLIHPDDAAARGIADGDSVELASSSGRVRVPAEVSAEIMRGVVSLPHGWGHARPDTRLAVANATPGVSVNDVTSENLFDPLSGNAALSGLSVELKK